MTAPPCRCDRPNPKCFRAGRPMVAVYWGQCQKDAALRAAWDRVYGGKPRAAVTLPVAQASPAVCEHLGAVEDSTAPCSRDWLFSCALDVVPECRPRDRFGSCEKYQPKGAGP
jgi:hypothetical protein